MGKVLSCYDVFMFTHTKDHDGKTFQVNKDKEVHVRHDHKKRVYRLRSYGRSIFPENSSQTCTSLDTSSKKTSPRDEDPKIRGNDRSTKDGAG
uniref:Uncharacterized protein n=1 Tax=Lactuca sativa TaxID=4236 RepID=A0A9R1USS5_LACSA|nr:hypothetical protein LSAT_V11C800415750 [Lactuca sativa]